ncbi:anticodon nuclease [Pseudomonas simiae]|uniref:Anticodon nuclease n=1 Tax=Pseudomonas simiae TaxID=321846 RepID=A0ABS9FZ01_9PSED|nr:anticodon nuclease [Pseudomonas simiae]MCF5186261.1 anticodon nuclease [Pseudomonas simiae]MCF5287441.1 anticodon nuclease [Pseudomonas simiae]MCF5318002.1 anticodon nuclease [Pseudomonas simiae]MCF5334364.1 anticodon nuclease [Pseudomonas simiae]MCF5349015.1 anticodon nuclease [Pseudomonas simiae]
MGKELNGIAQELKAANKKVQLIYAFNGTGKTRLSLAFKKEITPRINNDEGNYEREQLELTRNKILYYNALTEDLFYWDNDLQVDVDPKHKLKIQPNTFTFWLISLLKDLGEDGNIVANFQRYTSSNATPEFNEEYKYKGKDHNGEELEITVPAFSEITFKVAAKSAEKIDDVLSGDDNPVAEGKYETIKISKGEESNFIWSVIYTLLEQVVSTRNEADITNRITDKFNQLEYVFIDDPVSSLDDSHLIELAVDLAGLIKSSKSDLKFIVTTHSPLFYNVLCNELSNKAYEKQADGTYRLSYNANKDFKKCRLEKQADGNFDLLDQPTDSPFSYHLFLLSELQSAIKSGQIRKYHFSFVRNILEKLATFLGYNNWPALLPKTAEDKPNPFANRILNLSSHSAHAGEEIADIEDKDKEKLESLVSYLIQTYGFRKQGEQNG